MVRGGGRRQIGVEPDRTNEAGKNWQRPKGNLENAFGQGEEGGCKKKKKDAGEGEKPTQTAVLRVLLVRGRVLSARSWGGGAGRLKGNFSKNQKSVLASFEGVKKGHQV